MAFLVGAYARPFTNAIPAVPLKAADSASGRFTLVISPLVKSEKFLVDTQTGKIWQLVKPGEDLDKPFICQRIGRTKDQDHFAVRTAKDYAAKDKVLVTAAPTQKTPIDDATVEIISSGKVSQKKVHRIYSVTDGTPPKKQLSVKTPSQANL